MIKYNRVQSIENKRREEQTIAEYEKMKADIDYIAMMSDVDLTETDTNEEGGIE